MVANNLPVQPTPFVGRSKELQDIHELLVDPACRLLTLVGPGGIGKTRLALEAGRTMMNSSGAAPCFPDGVYFIPLQSLQSAELLVSTVGDVAGFQFYQGSDIKRQLLDFLQNKSMLLVLDNLEQLLDGVSVISEILANAPDVNMLVTSREALNLQEEWLYPISGMTVPSENQIDQLENFSAIQLFVQSARRVQPGFSLDTERASIARICRLVGGMPLGIELAAAWVRALSCGEIADEIAHGLDILETPARNVPERHRNMRAVLDQSWKLLDEDEQRILRRLSVFHGGFTREAAESVAGASARHLSALVDKSWLRRETKTGRYDLHELLRQYAGEHLAEAREAEAARDAHGRYFANFMQAREKDIKYRRQLEALSEIDQEFANVRAAWHRAAERKNHQVIDLMVEAMNFFCDMKARFLEGEELFRFAAERFASFSDPQHHHIYNRILGRRIRMILLGTLDQMFDSDRLVMDIDTLIAENRTYADRAELAFSLMLGGVVYHETGSKNADVRPFFGEAMRLYSEEEDAFYIGEMLVWYGMGLETIEETKAHLQRAYELQREIGDENGMGWSLTHLARMSFYQRRFAESDQFAEEALASQRRRGDVKGMYWSMMLNGEWTLRKGDFVTALNLAEECYKIALTLNLTTYRKNALATLGLLKIITEQDYAEGVRLCRHALGLEVPLSFAIGIPDLDAYSGLAFAAYQCNDREMLRDSYRQIVGCLPEYWDDANRFSYVVPIALLLYDQDGHSREALELTAKVFDVFQSPDQPVMSWLEKWPLLNRLRVRWEQDFGAEEYAAIWERGKKLDIPVILQQFIHYLEQPEMLTQPPSVPTQPLGDSITGRELEVLRLVADGRSNREIARELVLALGTVKWYISEIYGKLGVSSRTQAVARARELHLIA